MIAEQDKIRFDKRFKELMKEGENLVAKARTSGDLTPLFDAERIFNQLLTIQPGHLGSIFMMGCIALIRGMEGFGEVLLSIVYKTDKNQVNAANNLGIIYKNSERRKKAVSIYQEAIKTIEEKGSQIFPDGTHRNELMADLYANIGSCYVNNGTPDEAIAWFKKSLALKDKKDKDSPRFNMALAYLEKNDFKNAWPNYKYYSIIHPERRTKNYHSDENPTPKWSGDKNQVVAILGEQGLGDELMYASMIPDIMKDMKIIFDAHPRLQTLFKRAWPDLPIYGTRKDMESTWQQGIKPDAYIPFSEICEYYRDDISKFKGEPILTADKTFEHLLPEQLKQSSKRLKVGFAWTGGLPKTNVIHRTIPNDLVLKLLSQDCDFYSLQYKPEHNSEMAQICAENGIDNFYVCQDVLDDYDLTACMLEHLDLIFVAPQSVVFLAGALGVECYQLCPKRGMWQQGKYGEGNPWYKSIKNIWQQEYGEWGYCIDEAIKIINQKKDEKGE